MDKPLLTIVIPTYNEAKNVVPLLKRIRNTLSNTILFEMLFIDDSDDATPEIIRQEMSQDKRIRLIHRGKAERSGLATAVLAGFKQANGKYICCLDSDMQHPPEKISEMLQNIIKNDADITVASRYIPGGSAAGLGTKYRRAVSIASKYLVHFTLNKSWNSSDPGSGFFIFKKAILTNDQKLRPRGFKILLELLIRTEYKKVSEVPYAFLPRESEASKATIKQGVEFLKHVWLLWRTQPRIVLVGKAAMLALVCGAFVLPFYIFASLHEFLIVFVPVFSILITLQGLFSLFLMLYAWEDPERSFTDKSPKIYLPPQHTFTALVPARHEEEVIGQTLRAISAIRYPEDMKEVIVICRSDDNKTIQAAEDVISKIGKRNMQVVKFDGYPINKPRGLNIGLHHATKDMVVIFDAEDEPHEDIYNIVNTVTQRDKADVVQSGVQLMNFKSQWFSTFNVLEYFFWFKSSLHYFSRIGFIPLGGNTVFFKKEWLEKIGGWDENALTEDADIGIRLSIAGAKIRVIYDEEHVTKEETPPNTLSFIKQRTRWNQGFIQVLFKGDWLKLPKLSQKLLALYVLSWPIAQAALFLYIPFSIWMIANLKLPVMVAMLANLPLYVLILYFITYNIGLYEFVKGYGLKYNLLLPSRAILTFYPFHIILSLSAFRALWRTLKGNITWEKTEHINAHRDKDTLPVKESIKGIVIKDQA